MTGPGTGADANRSTLQGIDAQTGAVLWRKPDAVPTADGPDYVAATIGPEGSGPLVALDRKTGQQRWRVEITEFFSAAAGDDAVLVSTDRGTTAYDAKTGAPRWTAPIGPASDTFAVRVIDGVVTGAGADGTGAYDLATGRVLWTSPASLLPTPELTDGNVYVNFGDGALGALDARTVQVRWRIGAKVGGGIIAKVAGGGIIDLGVIQAGPGLVVVTLEAEFQGLDPVTGTILWRVPTTEPGQVSGLPSTNDAPGKFSASLINVLPSRDGVFFSYGNCLGS